MSYPCVPVEQRFWSGFIETGGCWPWRKGIGSSGYGHIHIGGKRGHHHGAHRIAYRLFVGPIPRGLNVLHRCDNRACVRPDHLFLGTAKDNAIDRSAKGQSLRGTRHPLAKLDDAKIRAIRELKGRLSYSAIAAKFGVSLSLITKIFCEGRWNHVV